MITISQLKMHIDHTQEELQECIRKKAGGRKPVRWRILRRSLDARKKPELFYVYTIEAEFEHEEKILSMRKSCWTKEQRPVYAFPNELLAEPKDPRPVVVGFGPAGMFAALILARSGYRPLILERGDEMNARVQKIQEYWDGAPLDTESNIQFGEGGAGTFSDGKLNTLIKDRYGLNRFVLQELAAHGAPEEILYEAKPHIGTDRLRDVVRSIRTEIMEAGGEIRFRTRVKELLLQDDIGAGRKKLTGVITEKDGIEERIDAEHVILAIGHSARDTFSMLYQKNIVMRQKAFAIGIRIEHPALMIDRSQYGEDQAGKLPAASYKLTHTCRNNRGVYSFCMCPGGYVVNSSSEEKMICVNGMSDYKRDARNSNSAIITTVGPGDFGSEHPLAGVEYQRKYEQMAYAYGMGKVPLQLLGDFRVGRFSIGLGDVMPCIKGAYRFSNLRGCLPDYVCESILEGIEAFGKKIQGFDRPDALLSGVETRTSSPVRIERDNNFESSAEGVYPCGEGAGYAGGITSAAMDGIRTAQALAGNIVKKRRAL